jgi:hypothetical protein
MPNLHNRYKSAERKISQKNPEYMLKPALITPIIYVELKAQSSV